MLESDKITKRFGQTTAVDRVTLCMEPGHSYAMLGPNGSGKTTWMKLAADLLLPTSGAMLLDGEPVSMKTRARTAYMSTDNFLYTWMTVGDVGLYFQRFFPDYELPVFERLVREMNLEPRMRVKALSSGMMAKLKVAIILCRKAGAYLMDEPFNGIDLISRDEIAEAIAETFTPQTVMVLSSHLVEELEGLADTAVFMREGKLVGVRDIAQLRQETGLSLSDVYRRVYGEERWDLRC